MPLKDWTFLAGKKAEQFLQGHLTCDLQALDRQAVLLGAACNLKGRVVASMYVMRRADMHYLFLPQETLPHLLDFWRLYLPLYRQTEFVECRGEIAIVSATYEAGGDLLSFPFLDKSALVFLPHNASPHKKHQTLDAMLPGRDGAQDRDILRLPWEEFLIRQKTPYILAASSGKWTPQMLGYDKLDAVSYDKGCYLGQEVVARAHYLGKASRGCYLLEFSQPEPYAGMEFYNAKGDKTGEIVNFCPATATPETAAKHWRCLAILNHNSADLKYLFADRKQQQPVVITPAFETLIDDA